MSDPTVCLANAPKNASLAPLALKVPELMSGVAKLDVPLVVEPGVGMNWEEAH